MNAICRPCLFVVVVIGCISAQADEKPSPKRTEYDEWIKPCTAKAESGWFPGPKGATANVETPLKLIVTVVENDEPQAKGEELSFSRKSVYGCQVAIDGQVRYFFHGPRGSKGSGYPKIPDADRKRLDKLLLKLPDDGAQLPPPGRRLVLQVPKGNHCQARVYDRANAPDEVWETLRLSLSAFPSWVPEIKSESEIKVGGDAREGLLALTPNGQLVVASVNSSLTFWDPTRTRS